MTDSTLKQLEAAIQAMAGGEFDAPLDFDTGGPYDNLLAMFEDMRQSIKMACDELEDNAKQAAEASRAKSDFLANMSHELRTPMNGVMGMAEMLLDSSLSAEQYEYGERIKSSAENLLVILNDILDFSKIEADSLELERVVYMPIEVATDVQKLLEPLAQEKGIELALDFSSAAPSFLMGDPGRVRQVLMNLVGNAVKFTPAGGVVVHVTAAEDTLVFAVKDTGVGIAEDKLEVIFNKFAQADSSMARKFGGTGLGLAITQKLVELMGGEITVESEVGVGSTFTFTVPVVEPDAMILKSYSDKKEARIRQHAQFEAILPAGHVAVLLVEDDPVNQEVARKFLEKLGFAQVDCANDGQDAVGMYEPDLYQLILMDCQMPNMDGFEATQMIRQREEELGIHTPIVAATANAMVGDKEKCLAAGMDDYLSKPIKMAALKDVLGKYVLFSDEAEGAGPEAEVVADVFAPVDLEHLNSFTDGDMGAEKELLSLFFDTARGCLSELGQHMESPEEWQAMSHRLKGSTGNLGAFELSEMCKQMEMEKDAMLNDKQAMLTAVRAGLEELRDYMLERHQTTMEETLWLK